jgi:hypothetical protein
MPYDDEDSCNPHSFLASDDKLHVAQRRMAKRWWF